jgi:hypothetical protein
MKKAVVTALVLVAIAWSAAPVAAREKGVAGMWTLTVEAAQKFPLRFVLSQKGRAVTGTLDYPHGAPFRLSGAFTNGALTFSGDSSGDGFTIHIDGTGSLKSDGSLAGAIITHISDLNEARQVIRTHNEEWKWTAVRATLETRR